MSLAIIFSRALAGIDAPLVTIEVHLSNGLPGLHIVGLPEKAVKESKERVRSAIMNCHFEFPIRRITVNLAPADLPKEGGRFDLPIALGILAASKQIPQNILLEYEFVGELTLSGELFPVKGILPFALETAKTKRNLFIPSLNQNEASVVDHTDIYAAKHLLEVCGHLHGHTKIQPINPKHVETTVFHPDFKEVIGQHQAKRGLEIAAAGGHSLLMIGPPGSGKTMLASRLPGILPLMTTEEALEVAAIYSLSRYDFSDQLWRIRPFRAPHHSASTAALIGGGNPPFPGEISLAHRGILFLDELPEFNRHLLESLREPLESGDIHISRAAIQARFPARFQLIAAMNPCPCGHLGEIRCHCTAEQIKKYQQRISGPLLDRIDLHVAMKSLSSIELLQKKNGNEASSDEIRERVNQARNIQYQRAKLLNGYLDNQSVGQYCGLSEKLSERLEEMMNRFLLTARSFHRILKVARTIADLDHSDHIQQRHLDEAMFFRCSIR